MSRNRSRHGGEMPHDPTVAGRVGKRRMVAGPYPDTTGSRAARRSAQQQQAEAQQHKGRDALQTRFGPAMIAAMDYLIRNGGVARSKYELAKVISRSVRPADAYPAITRLLATSLITIDLDHPLSSKAGKGALVVTDFGRQLWGYRQARLVAKEGK